MQFESETTKKLSPSKGARSTRVPRLKSLALVGSIALILLALFNFPAVFNKAEASHKKIKAQLNPQDDASLNTAAEEAKNFAFILEREDSQFSEAIKTKFLAAAKAVACEFTVIAADVNKTPASARKFHFTFKESVAMFVSAKGSFYKLVTQTQLKDYDDEKFKGLFEGFCKTYAA